MRALALAALFGGVLLLPAAYAGTDQPQAQRLFAQMERAARTLDYRGIFIYQNGTTLSTMKIEHAWYAGKTHERLVSQDGAPREVLVNGDLVTYVRPLSKSVVIMRRDSRAALPGHFGAAMRSTSYYHLELGASKRVAGQHCRVLMLRPMDRFRYEHRLCVAAGNKLPLESEVIDHQGKAVERMFFTSIELDKGLQPVFFKPPVLGPQYTFRWIRNKPHGVGGSQTLLHWHFRPSALPPGFALHATQVRRLGGIKEPVCHFVLSDGIATVSVFITKNRQQPVKGMAKPIEERNGALNVLTTSSHGASITAMGEVPRVTIKGIVDALHYVTVNP